MACDLNCKTAVVTGAGRGIGREIALTLGRAGARVWVVSRTQEELDKVVSDIEAGGGSAEAMTADLTVEREMHGLFEHVKAASGHLDILVNNAGCGIYGPTVDFPPEDFDKVIAVNLRATFLCCQHALKLMIPRRAGTIINIGSVVGFKGYPQQAAYTASKHGVVGLTKALSAEVHEYGIRVCVVNPGGTDTEMVRKSRPDIPTTDLMSPGDVAGAVEYILSLSDKAAVDEIYIRRRTSKPF